MPRPEKPYSTLRRRCKEFLLRLQAERSTTPYDDLAMFVISEQGRAADPRLEMTEALVLYFESKEERDAFVTLYKEARPGAITKKLP